MTTPPAQTKYHNVWEIPAAEKELLFMVRPPDNWSDMTQVEKLAWADAICAETVVRPPDSERTET
jgi:hypothetical protein